MYFFVCFMSLVVQVFRPDDGAQWKVRGGHQSYYCIHEPHFPLSPSLSSFISSRSHVHFKVFLPIALNSAKNPIADRWSLRPWDDFSATPKSWMGCLSLSPSCSPEGASMRFPSYTFSFLCTLQPHLTDAPAEHSGSTGNGSWEGVEPLAWIIVSVAWKTNAHNYGKVLSSKRRQRDDIC